MVNNLCQTHPSNNSLLDMKCGLKDFTLYYTLSDKNFAQTLQNVQQTEDSKNSNLGLWAV